MQVIERAEDMQSWSESQRKAGLKVGCVPTMGFLHEGHLSLVEECARRSDKTVMTLFVNPGQFSPDEDFEDYPRDFQGDCDKAEERGAELVFAPSVSEMYPEDFQTCVNVENITRDLEGAHRPTHFRGVATVVFKLFNAVRPHLAVFGEKDYQQLKVIEQMVKDLNMGVEIVGLPTVREEDGIAMSSRNVYLSSSQREQALAISRALFDAESRVKNGEQDPAIIVKNAVNKIIEAGLAIDYVVVRDADTLEEIPSIDRPARMLIAARVDKVRLIDNTGLFPA